jgi:hypothetical protein
MDALDYTPQQALIDAMEATYEIDPDGAIILLLSNTEGGVPGITHFISGVKGLQAMSFLEIMKTKVAMEVLSGGAQT